MLAACAARAWGVLLLLHLLSTCSSSAAQPSPGPGLAFECKVRQLCADFADSVQPGLSSSRRQAVADALRLQECPPSSPRVSPPRPASRPHAAAHVSDELVVYVATNGSDSAGGGTAAAPFQTVGFAVTELRRRRAGAAGGWQPAAILMRPGHYHLTETLQLDERDNNLTIAAEIPPPLTSRSESESGGSDRDSASPPPVVLSGGAALQLSFLPVPSPPPSPSAQPRAQSCSLLVAHLTEEQQAMLPAAPRLFDRLLAATPADAAKLGLDHTASLVAEELGLGPPLVWAREPNGNAERDLMPTGYALANGNLNGTMDDSGGVHIEVDQPVCNSSIYPYFGRDYDPRNLPAGYVWFHEGGNTARFVPAHNFWNATVPLGLRFNRTGGVDRFGFNVSGFSVDGWTRADVEGAVAHVFHEALWGNWFFQLADVDNVSATLTFARGGWQVSRRGGVSNQPFFVAGVRQALDQPGEWWYNQASGDLYICSNTSASTGAPAKGKPGARSDGGGLEVTLVAPRLVRLVEVGSAASQETAGIRLSGLTLTHSATSILEPYSVPSAGDWSIARTAALVVENAADTLVEDCVFLRTGGNGLVVLDRSLNTLVQRNHFELIGDSAMAVIGSVPLSDGFTTRTYPSNTRIAGNMVLNIGLYGKQTSAVFIALACGVAMEDNVFFNGPRAAVNINDGFCMGHLLRRNLFFNWGPINTWNRQCYTQPGPGGEPVQYGSWNHIQENLIFNGPSGNRDLGNLFPSVDNDDGSQLFFISRNVNVYGGFKNYLGATKTWVDNLLLYPDRWSGGCLTAWGGEHHVYVNNTCVVTAGNSTQQLDPSPGGMHECDLDIFNSTQRRMIPFLADNTYYTQDGTYVMVCGHNLTMHDLQVVGLELNSAVHAGEYPGWLGHARGLLGL